MSSYLPDALHACPTTKCLSLHLLRDFLQIKNYKTYVKREIQNQSSLRHPLIVSIREVGNLFAHASEVAATFHLDIEIARIYISACLLLHLQLLLPLKNIQVCFELHKVTQSHCCRNCDVADVCDSIQMLNCKM